LQRLQQVRPALILLDMRMPSLDGMETMARIRANPEWREIPVIFVTVVEEPEQKIEALAAGAVDYVTKPFHVQGVLARVATHLVVTSLQEALSVELEGRAATVRLLRSSLEQAVVVATREGRVQFCTYRAGQLAKHYFGDLIEADEESMLPEK